jgi:hypothetical protein
MIGMVLLSLSNEQAIIVSSIISALIALVVMISNNLVLSFKEKKREQKKTKDTFKLYAHPIIRASEQLAWRLKEILEFNGAFFLPNAVINSYYQYKINSTIYRLCALLGWVQAAKREFSYFDTPNSKQHTKIQNAIGTFRKALADGSHIEISILGYLTKLFHLDISKLSVKDITCLGAELEAIVFNYISSNVKSDVKKISTEKQRELLTEILDIISKRANQSKVSREVITENRQTAINEIARNFCWIYRDWQHAIGDLMLTEINGAARRYDVIGYGEFEEMLKIGTETQKEWLKKISRLFEELDVSVDDRFDARVSQLKFLFSSILGLIKVFNSIDTGQKTITQDSFESLLKFEKENINLLDSDKPQKKRKKLHIEYK